MLKKTAGSTRKGRRALAGIAAVSLLSGVLVSCSSSSGGAGGTLTFLTNAESWTHADPNRNYTGQHIAWFGSFMHRTLTAYARAEGAAGSEVVADDDQAMIVQMSQSFVGGNEQHEGSKWQNARQGGLRHDGVELLVCHRCVLESAQL